MRHKAWWLLIGIAMPIVASPPALAASLAEMDAARVKGLAYLYRTQNGDGSWANLDSLKVQTTATALEALMNAGINSGKTYASASAWLANIDPPSVDSAARKIAALSRTGMNMKPQAQALLVLKTLSDRQAWGAYPQYGVSFPDTPLGIAAIRLSGYAYTNQSAELSKGVACEILPAQRPEAVGKGWAFTRSAANETANTSRSALLPTAITLLELATLRLQYGWTTLSCPQGSTYNLTTALNDGKNYLLSKRNADNGFGEDGVSTPMQTALAYLAIQAIDAGQPALAAAQDYLLSGAGAQTSDGRWGEGALTTALVLKTLPTLSPGMLADGDRDGVPDEVESVLDMGTSTTHADGRNELSPGNGQAIPGLNSSILVKSLRYLHPMSPLQLGAAGATSYVVAAGALPPGTVLDANGVVSGTPTRIGTYSLNLSVDGGAPALIQLVVMPPDGDLNDDGITDVADVALLERIELGLLVATPLQQVSADVSPAGNPDGIVDLADLSRLKRMVLDLE